MGARGQGTGVRDRGKAGKGGKHAPYLTTGKDTRKASHALQQCRLLRDYTSPAKTNKPGFFKLPLRGEKANSSDFAANEKFKATPHP